MAAFNDFLSFKCNLHFLFLDVHYEEDGKKTIEIRCVDYGNIEHVNEVWELDPHNATLPARVSHYY